MAQKSQKKHMPYNKLTVHFNFLFTVNLCTIVYYFLRSIEKKLYVGGFSRPHIRSVRNGKDQIHHVFGRTHS